MIRRGVKLVAAEAAESVDERRVGISTLVVNGRCFVGWAGRLFRGVKAVHAGGWSLEADASTLRLALERANETALHVL